jgi:PAS domain S-box-containing protein
MNDEAKTKEQLIRELKEARRRIAHLEGVVEAECKQAEEALWESEEICKGLVHSITDFIGMVDEKGAVLSVNKVGASLLRRESRDIVGQSIFDLFPKALAAQYSNDLGEVFETGESSAYEARMVLEGRESWMRVCLSPVKNHQGDVVAAMGVARDITEQKQNAKELERLIGELQEALADIKVFLNGNMATVLSV